MAIVSKLILGALCVALLAVGFAFATSSSSLSWSSSSLRYDHYKLVRVRVNSEQQLEDLRAIVGVDSEIDVWNTDGVLAANVDMDLFLSPEQYGRLEQVRFFLQNELDAPRASVLVDDMQQVIDDEQTALANRKVYRSRGNKLKNSPVGAFQPVAEDYFSGYRTYNETMSYLRDVTTKYESMTTVIPLGKTWQQRDIVAVKISTQPSAKNRPAIWLQSMVHSREWIGVPTTAWALTQFLAQYENGDETVTRILDNIDVYVLPIVNGDGYDFSWTKDRLWRKNRRDNGRGVYGVDLNRNSPSGWGVGASTSPSSLVYQGPNPMSEPEIVAVANYLRAHPEIATGIDFHSYSQLILRPYAYKKDLSKDEQKLKALGANMQAAIRKAHNAAYQNIRGVELYAAGGSFGDMFYDALNMKAGFTMELRDTGRYGFVLPEKEIQPTIEENWAAILEFATWSVNN